MDSYEMSKSKRIPQKDTAKVTDRSYCANREIVCTLLKFGGNSPYRPKELGSEKPKIKSLRKK